jgi:nitric oxide dioxygenase
MQNPPLGSLTRVDIAIALLESAANAVVASDREGIIVLWNAGAERIFGFTGQEALGKSLDIIIPEPLRARHWEGYRETVHTGTSRYGAGDMLAVPALHRDGHRISVEFTISMLTEPDGEVAGMVAVMADVTKRFEQMKLLRKQLAGRAATSS